MVDVAWAEPGKTVLISRTVNGLTNIWKYSLQDRSLTQITFGTGTDNWPMPDPGGKGIYFVNGKSSGSLTVYHVKSKESRDIVSEDATQPIISPDGKRLMYITLPGPQTAELWVSGIDGGNKLKLATGESLTTGTWASDNFHLSFWEQVSGANDKGYIVGADGSGLRQLPRTGVNVQAMVWSSDQKSVYVSANEKGGTIPTVWKWSVEGSNPPEKFLDNCCCFGMLSPAASTCLASYCQEKRLESTRSPSPIGNVPCWYPALRAVLLLLATASRSCMELLPVVKSRFTVSPGMTVKSLGRPRSP